MTTELKYSTSKGIDGLHKSLFQNELEQSKSKYKQLELAGLSQIALFGHLTNHENQIICCGLHFLEGSFGKLELGDVLNENSLFVACSVVDSKENITILLHFINLTTIEGWDTNTATRKATVLAPDVSTITTCSTLQFNISGIHSRHHLCSDSRLSLIKLYYPFIKANLTNICPAIYKSLPANQTGEKTETAEKSVVSRPHQRRSTGGKVGSAADHFDEKDSDDAPLKDTKKRKRSQPSRLINENEVKVEQTNSKSAPIVMQNKQKKAGKKANTKTGKGTMKGKKSPVVKTERTDNNSGGDVASQTNLILESFRRQIDERNKAEQRDTEEARQSNKTFTKQAEELKAKDKQISQLMKRLSQNKREVSSDSSDGESDDEDEDDGALVHTRSTSKRDSAAAKSRKTTKKKGKKSADTSKPEKYNIDTYRKLNQHFRSLDPQDPDFMMEYDLDLAEHLNKFPDDSIVLKPRRKPIDPASLLQALPPRYITAPHQYSAALLAHQSLPFQQQHPQHLYAPISSGYPLNVPPVGCGFLPPKLSVPQQQQQNYFSQPQHYFSQSQQMYDVAHVMNSAGEIIPIYYAHQNESDHRPGSLKGVNYNGKPPMPDRVPNRQHEACMSTPLASHYSTPFESPSQNSGFVKVVSHGDRVVTPQLFDIGSNSSSSSNQPQLNSNSTHIDSATCNKDRKCLSRECVCCQQSGRECGRSDKV